MVVIQRSSQTCNSGDGKNYNNHTTTGKNIARQCENHTSTTDNKVSIKDKNHPVNNVSSSSVACVITRVVGQAISWVLAAALSPSSLSSTRYMRSCHAQYFILTATLLFVSLVLVELNSTIIITHANNSNIRRDRRVVVTTVSKNATYHHAMVDSLRDHFRLETTITTTEENKKNDDGSNNNNNNSQGIYDIFRHEQQKKQRPPRVIFLTGNTTTFASSVNNIMIRRTLSDEQQHRHQQQSTPHLKPKRYTKKSCVPLSEWQTSHTPTTCNDIHALPLLPSGGTLVNRGSYRDVWIVADTNKQQRRRRRDRQPLILKMALYYKHVTEDNHVRHQRESKALSQMSLSSKHILKLYANCATSAVVEYGDGPDLERFVKQERKNRQQQKSRTNRLLFSSQRLLELVRDVAMGLAEAHLFRPMGVNNSSSNTTTSSLVATLAHTDIKPSQFVSVNGTFKLGDFNRCIFLTWDDATRESCPFDDGEVHRGRLRSPEEYATGGETKNDGQQQQQRRKKSEKIDIYAMGNIFYFLLTGGRYPFEDIASGKKMQSLIIKGERSPLPVEVERSEDDVVKGVVDVMRRCWASDPKERPTALEVVEYLRRLE